VTGPQISIEGFKFSPAAVTVPVGTTVTWTNNDGELHTVTSSASVFSSAGLEQDESFSYVRRPGTYEYYCSCRTCEPRSS
jgi:plastocyanin